MIITICNSAKGYGGHEEVPPFPYVRCIDAATPPSIVAIGGFVLGWWEIPHDHEVTEVRVEEGLPAPFLGESLRQYERRLREIWHALDAPRRERAAEFARRLATRANPFWLNGLNA